MKSGVAVPSAARLWSIFPVTLHVAACLFCHVVILYVPLVFMPHHVLLGVKPLLSGSCLAPQSALEPWVEEHIQGIL